MSIMGARQMDKATLRWLVTRYGPEVEMVDFYDEIGRVGERRRRSSTSNGVTTVTYELVDGRVATHHAAMYESFYFITEA